ncbi:MAG: tetratricopeptide repeat protein [Luteibaculaceae bacterium]
MQLLKSVQFALFAGLFALFLTNCGENTGKTKENNTSEDATLNPFLDSLNRVITENPKNLRNFFLRAQYYLDEGDIALADNDIERVLAKDSNNVDFLGLKGDLFFKIGDYKSSQVTFKRAVEIKPEFTKGWNKLAEIEFYLRNYKEAFRYINASLKVNPDQAFGYMLKGHIYRETGDSALAASSFKTATEVDPKNYNAFLMLGRLYEGRKGNLAVEYYNSAIELRPNLVEPRYAKAMYLQNNGRFAEAMETYRQIIEIEPKISLPFYNRGFIYLTEFDSLDLAIESFSEAILREPTYAEAFYNRGLSYEFQNKKDSAALDYRRALKLYPEYDLAAIGLERVLKKQR